MNPRLLAVSLTSSCTKTAALSSSLLFLAANRSKSKHVCPLHRMAAAMVLSAAAYISAMLPRLSFTCNHCVLLDGFPPSCFLWVMPRPRWLYFTLLCLGKMHPPDSLVLTFSPSKQPPSTAPITPNTLFHPFPLSLIEWGPRGREPFVLLRLPRCPPQCPHSAQQALGMLS